MCPLPPRPSTPLHTSSPSLSSAGQFSGGASQHFNAAPPVCPSGPQRPKRVGRAAPSNSSLLSLSLSWRCYESERDRRLSGSSSTHPLEISGPAGAASAAGNLVVFPRGPFVIGRECALGFLCKFPGSFFRAPHLSHRARELRAALARDTAGTHTLHFKICQQH